MHDVRGKKSSGLWHGMDHHQGFPMFSQEWVKDTAHILLCHDEHMEDIQKCVLLIICSAAKPFWAVMREKPWCSSWINVHLLYPDERKYLEGRSLLCKSSTCFCQLASVCFMWSDAKPELYCFVLVCFSWLGKGLVRKSQTSVSYLAAEKDFNGFHMTSWESRACQLRADDPRR